MEMERASAAVRPRRRSPGQFGERGPRLLEPNSTDGEPFTGARCLGSEATVITSALAGRPPVSIWLQKR